MKDKTTMIRRAAFGAAYFLLMAYIGLTSGCATAGPAAKSKASAALKSAGVKGFVPTLFLSTRSSSTFAGSRQDYRKQQVYRHELKDGDSVVVARGGLGGKGNTRFKSSTHQAPRESTPGGEAERRRLRLEPLRESRPGTLGRRVMGRARA
mgnify:CR=1 FL=1